MDTFIGFLELAGWALVIVALAAGITYAVIKLFPAKDESESDTSGASAGSR